MTHQNEGKFWGGSTSEKRIVNILLLSSVRSPHEINL